MAEEKHLYYRRSHFATNLPRAYLYSPTHYWLERRADNQWRVGLTKFATRMLGEMVDYGFETKPDAPVEPGMVLGWMEGFKAVSDVYCVASGSFLRLNPALEERISLINQDPYEAGWLYEVTGVPDERCCDVVAYRDHLDATIVRLLADKNKHA